ncbi:MAG: hypothetical protein J6T33_01680 [Bacteroidales bacterium]|nr:hypothetical protein [Bacteroidales bacterium]
MKKQQKIIELRTAAKCKVAEIETKIAFARSEAAEERARLMWERAGELEGLDAGSTERYDVLAKYRAKLAVVDAGLAATVAQLKSEIQQTKSGCEQLCAASEDDPEPETANEQSQQETVYCDGSEHSARIVARRLINKMPHIPDGGSINVNVIRDTYADRPEYFVGVSYGNNLRRENEIFAPRRHTAELENAFMEKVRSRFAEEQESVNSYVAEPMARALDAVFGGNPLDDFPTIRKEGENE